MKKYFYAQKCWFWLTSRWEFVVRFAVYCHQTLIMQTPSGIHSSIPEDDVDSRVSVHKVTDVSHVQREGSIFECLLHCVATEHSQVAIICGWTTLAVLLRNPVKVFDRTDLWLEVLDVCCGLFFRACDGLVPVRVVRVPRTSMLLKDMFAAYLFRHFSFNLSN